MHRFCWKCGAETRIISSIDIQFGTHIRRFTVAESEKYMDLFSAILSGLSPSNGCSHSDAVMGQSYYGQIISCPVIEISERWRQAITADGRFEFGWGIYEQGGLDVGNLAY
jgi:hypothetical protein